MGWRRMDVDGGRPQTSPRLADQPPPPRPRAFSRQRVEPIRQSGERGDCLLGPRPLGLQTGGGGEFELQRRIGDGGIDAGFTAVALAASMRPRRSGIRSCLLIGPQTCTLLANLTLKTD